MIISCKTFTHLFGDAGDGELSGFQQASVKLHHTICPYCRSYARGMSATVEALHDLPEEEAPEETKSVVLKRLREKRGG
jgi:hypothetical protein